SPCHFLSFFSCSSAPRDLHPFPTRRSSDLVVVYCSWVVGGAFAPFTRSLPPLLPPPCGGCAGTRAGALTSRKEKLMKIQHRGSRSEEHTSELQSRENLVCRLLLEKKKKHKN